MLLHRYGVQLNLRCSVEQTLLKRVSIDAQAFITLSDESFGFVFCKVALLHKMFNQFLIG